LIFEKPGFFCEIPFTIPDRPSGFSTETGTASPTRIPRVDTCATGREATSLLRKRLVLGGGGDIALHGKMSQKSRDLDLAHLCRMPFTVEQNEALDPIYVALLGAQAVMFAAQHVAYLVQEPGFGYRLGPRIRPIE
jgi:hypothetical protein